MSENRTYRAALVGCGRRGGFFPGVILGEKRCALCALCDADAGRTDEVAKKYGLSVPLYEDYMKMAAEQRPDIVVIVTRTRDHERIITDLARAGIKNILCEKPMAGDWGACRRIAAVAEETGANVNFCHQRRFAPGNLYIRKLIREGRFGDILRLDLFVNRHLLDCGTHTFDQAFSYLEESPVKWALGGMDVSEPVSYFEIPAENAFCGTLMYENGVVGTVFCHLPGVAMKDELKPELKPGETRDPWYRAPDCGVRIIGTKGFAEVEWEGEILRYSFPDGFTPEIVDPCYSLTAMLTHMIDCLERGEESQIGYRRALRAAEVVFALYQSVRLKRIVALPLGGAFDDNPFETMRNTGF